MASTSYDIITIGGGLGGAALAKVMAERGARVLVLESETRFRDRVRGEVILSWGVAEAKELGIYEMMRAAGGREVEWGEMAIEGNKPVRRHMPTTTVPGTPQGFPSGSPSAIWTGRRGREPETRSGCTGGRELGWDWNSSPLQLSASTHQKNG